LEGWELRYNRRRGEIPVEFWGDEKKRKKAGTISKVKPQQGGRKGERNEGSGLRLRILGSEHNHRREESEDMNDRKGRMA